MQCSLPLAFIASLATILCSSPAGLRQGLSPYMGGRAFGPPLCRGCAPATPPSKTRPHRHCAFIAACPLASAAATAHQLRHQNLNSSNSNRLVKYCGLVVAVTTLRHAAMAQDNYWGTSPPEA